MSISKQGMQDAMNLYYYNGYKGMSDAIDYSMDKAGSFRNRMIAEAFGFNPNDVPANGNFVLPAKNGITYSRIQADEINTPIVLQMEFPNTSGTTQVRMFYTEADGNGLLVPGDATFDDGTVIQLYNRKDLLPFYIDNGTVGRYIQNVGNGGVNAGNEWGGDITYRSFHDAYCRMSTNRLSNDVRNRIQNRVSGSAVNCAAGAQLGILRVANPKKAY